MIKNFTTRNLFLIPAAEGDLAALETIECECDEYFNFDPPRAAEHNRTLRECLAEGDMIPGVPDEEYEIKNYVLYCVKKNDETIGWLSLYYDYTNVEIVYISVLYLAERFRAAGLGAEIIEALSKELSAAGYKYIYAHCSLRNALALRFWVRNGFNRITEVNCEANLYQKNFGGLGLMKELRGKDETSLL